jgi:hypothetical protein
MGRKIIVGSIEMGLPNVNLRNNGHARAQTMLDNYKTHDITSTPGSKKHHFLSRNISQRTLNHGQGSMESLSGATPNRHERTMDRADMHSNASLSYLHDNSPATVRFKSVPRKPKHILCSNIPLSEMALEGKKAL